MKFSGNSALFADEGAVFKAKGRRRETIGAEEVPDDSATAVELPVDQQDAQQVEVCSMLWGPPAASLRCRSGIIA